MAHPTPSSQNAPPLTHREKLFSYQHPSLQRKPSVPAPKPSPPLHFLDRHLSKSLILKRVKLLPLLQTEMFAGLDSFSKELDALEDTDFGIPFRASTMTRVDAPAIIRYRSDGIEAAVTQIASSLVFHPSEPDLWQWLRWTKAPAKTMSSLIDQDYASQNLLLQVAPPPPDEVETFSRKHRNLLERLRRNTALLTSYMVFCTDALPLMKDMDRLGSMDVFPWRFDSEYSASGSREKALPPDASEVPYTLPKSTGPRRSRRVRYQEVPKPANNPQDIGVNERPGQKDTRYQPVCDDYVQKAWVAAVRNDATAVLFDCGNFLRIGIRHRERQTLYLSSLIDIRTCKDPTYGGIWTALHVAIAADAVQRLPLLENTVLGKRKSTFELEPHCPIKAAKTHNPTSAQEELLSIDKAMAAYMEKFPVLAVFFRFDYLDSPAPLLLFSPDSKRKMRYEPTEYLKVIAYKQLGSGSVKGPVNKAGRSKGKAKPAKATSESLPHRPFILKVAPTDTRARRLQHEAQVYRHLHDKGVSGIPSVLSYREGVNADLRVLMLSDAGRSLGYRMDSDKKVDLSAEAGVELKSILTAIHEAGVLHRDVRSWNIMEDDFGRVRFTDFDRSSFRGTSEDYQAEQERLDRFIAGEFVDKDDIIGADDLRRRTEP
ncbi:hypothetical protein CPB85DRAFT_1441057 [Mucidula mucida]|nr:hypothetical protein CPB85DRAFT_1441057 [Mucidula mucida]